MALIIGSTLPSYYYPITDVNDVDSINSLNPAPSPLEQETQAELSSALYPTTFTNADTNAINSSLYNPQGILTDALASNSGVATSSTALSVLQTISAQPQKLGNQFLDVQSATINATYGISKLAFNQQVRTFSIDTLA